MRTLALLLAFSPALLAQDPAKAFPQNYKLLLDDPDFTVYRVHYRPHEQVGVHDHSDRSTVYVYLNDAGPVRFLHSEESHPFDLVRPPTHAGAFRVSPGRIERHAVDNLSDTPSDYVRVELKRFPVKSLPEEFRGPAPQPPLHPGTTIVYDNPKLRIERIICPAQGDCLLPAEARESVVIRIPNHPMTASESERSFADADKGDDIFLMPARPKSWNFVGDGTAPFQVLRISTQRDLAPTPRPK